MTLALGQGASARLDGVVQDQTGAVLPGVGVTLTSDATNLTHEVISNERGVYIFVNLSPGTYTLAAELPGFKRYNRPNVRLAVGDAATVDIELETGEISEEVTVTSAAPTVDRVSQSIGGVVTEEKIVNLPLANRDPMNLFYLQAGVNRANEGFGGGRVDGLRMTTNNVQVEGISAQTPMLTPGASVSMAPVIPEAMAEYRVTTSSASAENGFGGGAQVQLIYKSGTNDFHGSVFFFHRNRPLNANNFFNNRQGIERPAFLRHQYGFAVGGPIVKDKAFFHFTYEQIKQRTDTTRNLTVYTDRFKQTGVFQFRNTATNEIENIDLTTVDPTRTGIHPAFSAFANSLPSPNNNDLGDGLNTAAFRYSSNQGDDDWKFVLKGDYVFNDQHRMGVSWADRTLENLDAFHIDGFRLSTFTTQYPAGIVTLTSSFSPTFLNELRMGGTKRGWEVTNGNPNRFRTEPLLNFDGLGAPARGTNANASIFLPQAGPSATLTINDNVTWIKTNHTFKAGLDIRINRSNVGFGGDFYLPVADTNNSFNPANIPALTGLSSSDRGRAQQLTNDITASLGAYQQDFQQIAPGGGAYVPFETKFRRWRSREYSFFFQDTWKARPNLTLQLGLRYEVMPPHFEAQGIFSYPVDTSGNACAACLYGISGPGTTDLGPLPEAGREIYETDLNNFAPNIGFTWDPTGSGKWSIASNYRVAYDRNPLVNTLFQDFSQEGASTAVQVFGSSGQTFSSLGAVQAGINPGVPFGPKAFDRQGLVTVWDPNYARPYVQSWSLRIQREIMRNTVIEAAYVGNHGVGLPRAVDINQLEIRSNGFLDGFLIAQQNLAANMDPLVGGNTGVFGQLFGVLTAADRAAQSGNISRGEVAAVADFIDRSRASSNYLQMAGLPLNFFRANPQFNQAWLLGNVSHSTYNGLKLDLRRRFSDGLQFQLNYTFSKALTDYEGGQSQRDAFRDNLNRGLDKSRSAIDARHIVNANGIYELPVGRNRRWGSSLHPVIEHVIGGWQINGILAYSSGQPVTIEGGGRETLTFGDAGTATFLGDDPSITSSVHTDLGATITALTPEEKALFLAPEAGSAGLTAQRYFPAASFWVLDGSIFKSFGTPWFGNEGSELQFRFEFFNLTNSTRFQSFNSAAERSVVSPSFANVSSARDARIMQVALKFLF